MAIAYKLSFAIHQMERSDKGFDSRVRQINTKLFQHSHLSVILQSSVICSCHTFEFRIPAVVSQNVTDKSVLISV